MAPQENTSPQGSIRIERANSEKIRISEKLGYAGGDFACGSFFLLFSFYGLYFYTDVFGIAPAAVGIIFLIARLWDAINDPIMGIIADRTRSRWGRFRPYLLWMAIPFAVTGIACFVVPEWGLGAKVAYAAVTYTLFGMVYTAVNLPYSGLMGVISPDSLERTKLAQFRFIGAYSGGLFIALAFTPLVATLGNGSEQTGYFLAASLVAVIAALLLATTFLTTRERLKPIDRESPRVLADLKDLLANRAVLVLFSSSVLYFVGIALHLASVPFYFKYYVRDSHSLFGWMLSADSMIGLYFSVSSVFLLIGVLATSRVARKFGKINAYIVLLTLGGLFWGAQYFVPAANVSTLFALEAAGALVLGPLDALAFAMFADVVDHSEWKTGRRATGLVMAVASFGRKAGWAVGGALAGFMLAWYGYVPNEAQSTGTTNGIRLMLTWIPAVTCLVASAVLLFYPLSERKVKEVTMALQDSR